MWESFKEGKKISIVKSDNILHKLLKVVKFYFTGSGIEGDEQKPSFIQYLAGCTLNFKLICRYLMFKYPQQGVAHTTTLDLNHSNLKDVYEYTVAQSHAQNESGSFRRMEVYYKLVALPPGRPKSDKILIIGCRNVIELFLAWTYGFKWKNITGIDLFSLHPKIKIMDMEDISYPDESFDCVTMANVYGYNADPERCFKEIARVLKPSGLFSFNSAYVPTAETQSSKMLTSDLHKIFNRHGLTVVYHYETRKGENVSHLWCLQKSSMS